MSIPVIQLLLIAAMPTFNSIMCANIQTELKPVASVVMVLTSPTIARTGILDKWGVTNSKISLYYTSLYYKIFRYFIPLVQSDLLNKLNVLCNKYYLVCCNYTQKRFSPVVARMGLT